MGSIKKKSIILLDYFLDGKNCDGDGEKNLYQEIGNGDEKNQSIE